MFFSCLFIRVCTCASLSFCVAELRHHVSAFFFSVPQACMIRKLTSVLCYVDQALLKVHCRWPGLFYIPVSAGARGCSVCMNIQHGKHRPHCSLCWTTISHSCATFPCCLNNSTAMNMEMKPWRHKGGTSLKWCIFLVCGCVCVRERFDLVLRHTEKSPNCPSA